MKGDAAFKQHNMMSETSEPNPTDSVDNRAGFKKRRRHWRQFRAIIAVMMVVLGIAIPLLVVPQSVRWWQARRDAAELAARGEPPAPAIKFPDKEGDPLTIHKDRWEEIGLKLASINPTPLPKPLVMDGILYLDPDDYALVRSRFAGEVVEVAQVDELTASGSPGRSKRPLRFGDEVKKGQVLAVVWSRELGEKKSELDEYLSALAFDRETLQRLSRNEGAVPLSAVREAERRVRQNEIAVDRVEKTLRSWRLLPEEIQEIRQELTTDDKVHNEAKTYDSKTVNEWARVEIHSPIDGTLVEKNVTVGALVDLTTTLFRVANLNHLDVRAFAYEEDLAALQRLSPRDRNWTVQLKGDAMSPPIVGVFDRIGNLIDPLQHTGLVMGWVDNANRRLRAGQFVTCSVALPDNQPLMSVPATSVVDSDGHSVLLIQMEDNPEQFMPVEVRVIRFQDDIACIEPQAIGCADCLSAASNVVSAGAVEILAEYRAHLRSRQGLEKSSLRTWLRPAANQAKSDARTHDEKSPLDAVPSSSGGDRL